MKYREIKNFIREEFIGYWVEVIFSKNPKMIGIHGEIIDETKNTFRIKTERSIKIIPKKYNTFLFFLDDYVLLIDGKLLVGRPWERLKKKIIKRL